MRAQDTPCNVAAIDINHLQKGGTYKATTRAGNTASGEYLGIEVAYDDWMIILRDRVGDASIPVRQLASVQAAA